MSSSDDISGGFSIDSIAQNLKQPDMGEVGAYIGKLLTGRNATLETSTADICKIGPNYHVLEVGFGPGVGLKRAAQSIEKGVGKVHGIELSPAMVIEAIKNLPDEIAEGKVELVLGDAVCMPYRDESMDCIFHVNCYYFWPDITAVVRELLRVLKPGGIMVAGLVLERVKASHARGWLKYGKYDPDNYIARLREVGFVTEGLETRTVDESSFQAIVAQKPS
ncbi:uncharacterized methyltransferase YdaC-like [Diadema antillarum]|uniref:uncharacterized methyltransferase YdaC-like n=1 Tax=Diadema antillarum TaxID=105358 RepID=UPI003A8775C9